MLDDEVKIYRSGLFWEITFRRLVIEVSPRWYFFPFIRVYLLPSDPHA